jgi:hypothetical protein
MSSLEIAELTEKDHRNVMRDIRQILTEAGIDLLKFEQVYTAGNGQIQPCFNLPRRECDLVISGYSVKYRLAIIDRWHMLEAVSAITTSPAFSEEAKAAAIGVELFTKQLNLVGSAQLGMLTAYAKNYAPALLAQLPVYAIDAPAGSLLGSSKVSKSATALLAEHGKTVSAKVFNTVAESEGMIEKQTRKATKGEKSFWTVTEKGQKYGKNVTSPNNQRETQPQWFVETFDELLIEIGLG